MQQNPSQGIQKYNIDDVYTPSDSNSRRERMSFDFVITDKQLTQYKQLHQGNIDIGELILSKEDGSSGEALEAPLSNPISILIDAHTTESDVFDFYSSRIMAANQIFTAAVTAAWAAGYSGKTLVHVYSRAPYAVTVGSTGGGIAYHSTPEAYIKIPQASSSSAGLDGVCKIGVCKVTGAYNRYGRRGWDGSTGLTVIYEKCLSGTITWEDIDSSERPWSSDTPGAVCAPWMSSSVDCEIEITSGLARKYGIFSRIEQARSMGAEPVIVATEGQALSKLRFVSTGGTPGGTDAFFAFEGDGKRLVVGYYNTLTWSSQGGVSQDVRVRLIDQHIPEGAEPDTRLRYAVTESRGNTVQAVTFYGSNSTLFDFGSASALDWYTWTTVTVGTSSLDRHEEPNGNKDLYLNADTLAEGVVYEVNLALTHMHPMYGGREELRTEEDASGKVTRVYTEITGAEGSDSSYKFALHFCDSSGAGVPLKGWAPISSPTSSMINGAGVLTFRLHRHLGVDSTAPGGDTFPEEAHGKAIFFKHGGNVYILGY